jgi:RNA polymerase sigma-70 factor, ECF subfamily
VSEKSDLLARALARAHAAWPSTWITDEEFLAHVAEHARPDDDGVTRVETLHVESMYLALASARGVSDAIAAFEASHGNEIEAALRAMRLDEGLTQDASHALRGKLFLLEDGRSKLLSYSGRGDLGAWLRTAATRVALDLMRARREIPVGHTSLDEAISSGDPALEQLKVRYRDEFRRAFATAAAALSARDRTLLRYRYLDDLNIDEIASLYGTHRATAARWLAAIRDSLFEGTRRELVSGLGVNTVEVDSILRLIESQLDASMGAFVRVQDRKKQR